MIATDTTVIKVFLALYKLINMVKHVELLKGWLWYTVDAKPLWVPARSNLL